MKRATCSILTVFSFSLCLLLGSLPVSQALAELGTPTVSAQNQMNTELIDINAATLKELRSLPGIGTVYSKQIAKGRPYNSVEELRTKKVLPKGIFGKIKHKVVTKTH